MERASENKHVCWSAIWMRAQKHNCSSCVQGPEASAAEPTAPHPPERYQRVEIIGPLLDKFTRDSFAKQSPMPCRPRPSVEIGSQKSHVARLVLPEYPVKAVSLYLPQYSSTTMRAARELRRAAGRARPLSIELLQLFP